MQGARRADRLPLYTAVVVAIGLVATAASGWMPSSRAARLSAFFGVAAVTFSGLVALVLKRWALRHAVKWVLGIIGALFMLRLLLLSVGLILVRAKNAPLVPFVIAFFAVYFVLQWVEISYVVAESKRHSTGAK